MILCRVDGTVVATVKHPAFLGRTLLIVQPITEAGAAVGKSFIAVDHAQAGEGDRVLVLRERRTLSKNLTLSYGNVIYQIKTKRPAYTMRSAHVEVRETSGAQITIEYKGRPLEDSVYRKQEQHQGKVIPAKLLALPLSRVPPPKKKPRAIALSHPWRNFDYSENSMRARERRGELCILRK